MFSGVAKGVVLNRDTKKEKLLKNCPLYLLVPHEYKRDNFGVANFSISKLWNLLNHQNCFDNKKLWFIDFFQLGWNQQLVKLVYFQQGLSKSLLVNSLLFKLRKFNHKYVLNRWVICDRSLWLLKCNLFSIYWKIIQITEQSAICCDQKCGHTLYL